MDAAVSAYRIGAPCLICLAVAGSLGNLLILVSLKWIPLLNPTLKLTYSLAATDCVECAAMAISLIIYSYLPVVHRINLIPARGFCTPYVLETFRLGFMLSSVFHMLFLAGTHFFATCAPMTYQRFSVGKLSFVNRVIFLLWTAPVLTFFCIFVGHWNETYFAEPCNSRFMLRPGFSFPVFGLILTLLLIMVGLYVKMIRLLFQLSRRLQNDDRTCVLMGLNTNARSRSFLRRRTRTMLTSMLITGTFLIGWVPGTIWFALTCGSCIFPATTIRHRNPQLFYRMGIIVNFLFILKGVTNPLIYALRVPDIGHAMALMFGLRPRQRRWERSMSAIASFRIRFSELRLTQSEFQLYTPDLM